ncbi:methyltransferase domain-containing protein [Radiomyces spectabilis]|uniref:methyltransferase domain-containing protein n=1 Tax=Radiomyces spectabilis TaxID=64574 RepID=UPI00221EDD99|nr:methyltransferase domain-containing protein [Radiomyces spectabilis]KAI8374354.1 methyltransferase domain-containing protein [Radiomyces spectabilis]
MSTLIKSVANDRGVNSAVDLGSGQGYLSRALAFQHDMQVLAVDMSEIQTRGAEKFDKTAYKGFARQHDEHAESPRLHHVTEKITPDNISDVLNRWGTNTDPNEQWLVCGLHACGDLSSMILRLFAESSEVSCMVNVGCCYHNLTCEDDEIETDDAAPIYGFPMSQALAGYKMGTTARVLACQSPWRWAEQKKGSHVSFLHHFYRALLQKMFVEKGLSTVSTPPVLGRMHKRKGFTDYIQTALRRLDMPAETISEEESNEYLEEYVSKRVDKQLVVLWMLRVLLAPVLESIVLVDRYLYLKEAIASSTNPQKGVWMFPLFDLSASPRNVVFIASK